MLLGMLSILRPTYRFIVRTTGSEMLFRLVHPPGGQRMSREENERVGCMWAMIFVTLRDVCLCFFISTGVCEEEGGYPWKCIDMCGDRWNDRRTT